MKTGPLHPCAVRQVTTPCPYCASTMKAPFLKLGTTAMQVAFCITLDGMLLSGVRMISSITFFDASTRWSNAALSLAANAGIHNPAMHTKLSSLFIGYLL